MKRLIVITALGLLLLINSHVGAGKLEKVSSSLEYFYNLYFDPEYVSEGSYLVTCFGLLFANGIPYVQTRLMYEGDVRDLERLGVDTEYYLVRTAKVRFPLGVLPDVVSLPAVKRFWQEGPVEVKPEVGDKNEPHEEANPGGVFGALLLRVTMPVESTRVQAPLIYNHHGALVHWDTHYFHLTQAGQNVVPIDSIPIGVCHLIINPLDTTLGRHSVCNIGIFPDSCTLVDLFMRKRTTEDTLDIEFLEWQRNDSNVTVIDNCRSGLGGNSKERLEAIER